MIGNPAVSWAASSLIASLGEDYVSKVFSTYKGRVPAEADLVTYWFVTRLANTSRSGKAQTGWARRDQFHSRRAQPTGVTGRDRRTPDLRGVE